MFINLTLSEHLLISVNAYSLSSMSTTLRTFHLNSNNQVKQGRLKQLKILLVIENLLEPTTIFPKMKFF